MEFSWLERTLPGAQLEVINTQPFETERIKGLNLEDFLLES
jgi:hypothetical protein